MNIQTKKILNTKANYPNRFAIYDYETYGLEMTDPISQVGVILANTDLVKLEAIEYYCHIPEHKIPKISSCAITGIMPFDLDKVSNKSTILNEPALATLLSRVFMSENNTCIVGYNNLSFDDRVTQHLYYRCFQSPYKWQFNNSNTRLDLYNLVKSYHNLCPKAIRIPFDEKGFSYRLDRITIENGFNHTNAHTALSDVEACLWLLGKMTVNNSLEGFDNPANLFNYLLNFRRKETLFSFLNDLQEKSSFGLIGVVGSQRKHATIATSLHTGVINNKDSNLYFLDLASGSLELLLKNSNSYEDFVQFLTDFYGQNYQDQGISPIINLALNKQPVLVDEICLDNQYLLDNRDLIESNRKLLEDCDYEKILSYCKKYFGELYQNKVKSNDQKIYYPETLIYEKFPEDSVFKTPNLLSTNNFNPQLFNKEEIFNNESYYSMYIIYCGAFYPNVLSKEEFVRWQQIKQYRLSEEIKKFNRDLVKIREDYVANDRNLPERFKIRDVSEINQIKVKIEEMYGFTATNSKTLSELEAEENLLVDA